MNSPRRVPAQGPRDALVLQIGEAPGREETRAGRPFVGPVGQFTRSAWRYLGLDDTRDIRYANVCDRDVGKITSLGQKKQLLEDYRDVLEEELRGTEARAVFLLGDLAVRRVLGPEHGITQHHASVEMLSLPSGRSVPVVSAYHPSFIKRDPRRVYIESWYRCAEWARDLATGAWTPGWPRLTIRRGFPEEPIRELVLDTEYDIQTHRPYMIGVASADQPDQVWHLPTTATGRLQELIDHAEVLVAHHVMADVSALSTLGVRVSDEKFRDTMLLHALWEPDYNHSLSFACRTMFPECAEWKYLSGDQESYYNALDVYWAARLYRRLLELGGLPEAYREFWLPNIRRAWLMEHEGMRVDENARRELRQECLQTMDLTSADLGKRLEVEMLARVRRLQEKGQALQKRGQDMRQAAQEKARKAWDADPFVKIGKSGRPLKRPEYTFRTRPRLPEAARIYDKFVLPARAPVQKLLNEGKKYLDRAEALREKGFRVTNDGDLRWYITEVLGKRTGRRTESGKVSVNTEALERFKDDPVVGAVWKAKHAGKLLSTFLNVPVDSRGYSHPPVRLHGTATGRPASGREVVDDKLRTGSGAFNAFNLPEEIRNIYVPEPGHMFIGLDFKDMEGRLVALDAGDDVMCELYTQGRDRHCYIAAKFFGCSEAETRERTITVGAGEYSLRKHTKRVNHGWSYGAGEKKIAATLQQTPEQVRPIIRLMEQEFDEVALWKERLRESVFRGERLLYTVTGRRRLYRGVEAATLNEVYAQRPQSHGADIWYRGLDRLCLPGSLRLRLDPEVGRVVIGTYDSYLIEVQEARVQEVAQWAREVLEQPMEWLGELPGARLMPPVFPVDVKIGRHYGEV